MKNRLILALLLIGGAIFATAWGEEDTNTKKTKEMKNMSEIYFAGGCFWGTEHYIKQIRGVNTTQVGYANGKGSNPTYEEVCSGTTGFAETVKVEYDPLVVNLDLLVELYFKTIDPTSLNKQGGDRGTQYRTGIYYTNEADHIRLAAALKELAAQYDKPIVVELMPLHNFYKAEGYHQDYLDKNPGGYCHISPDLFGFAKKANAAAPQYSKPTDEKLRQTLKSRQYSVTQKSATEPAFDNEYWNEQREGIYVDITTGEPLFSSTDKFDAGCGWPSFSKPIREELIQEKGDHSHGMVRTEVRSKTGDAHLGHLFDDGPKAQGGLRYCINSASLRFVPKEKMKEEGYGNYLSLFKN